MLQPAFFIVNMTQYVENFNLQTPQDHICRHSQIIQPSSSKLYFRAGGSSQYNFLIVSLVSSKTKQICIKK